MNTPVKWQAPGNGKGFDSFLGNNSKMNNRTIGIMLYIKEKSLNDGYIDEKTFISQIKEYLAQKFGALANNSLDTHFYKPALFYGFINRDANYNLSLSIEGNLFIKYYQNNDYNSCKKLIVNQLDNTSYPNQATPRVKELKLFPFRILFKLLLEKTRLSVTFLKENLVYINSEEDLQILNSFRAYDKFSTWVVNSLVDLEILNLSSGYVYINRSVQPHIESLYKRVAYSDMFFEHTLYEANKKIAQKRVKRDISLILEAKKRDDFTCQLDTKHKTFLVGEHPYVEGHHIVPMYQQKNYNFVLDSLENIISLCPNCHREVHHADPNREILKKLYNLHKKYMNFHDISLEDFYKMY